MKKFLQNLISRKQALITELRNRVNASEDINEVRSLGQQIEAAQAEIEEARTQLAACNDRLGNVRAEMDDDTDGQDDGDDTDDQDDGDGNPAPDDNTRSRNFRPGTARVIGSYDTRSNAPNMARVMEQRAQAFAKTGRQAVPATEARAVLVSGGKIATPTEVGGINDAFTQVSSIVDMVKVVDCTGMGAYKVAYEIASATAAKHTEGGDAAASDMTYDYVEITPETAAVVSYISKQVRKQSPLNYTEKVRASALTALRKYAANLIVTKIKASALTKALEGYTGIDDKTLRKVALNYGGNLGVEGGAVLLLNKASLIAFGDVRGTQDKKPVYEITPDTGNPNTGIIKDGGLSVKYCIEGNLADNELLYGNAHCFELGLFSDYEIAVSEDRAIEKLMLTIVGDVSLGGEVVVNEGFIKAATA